MTSQFNRRDFVAAAGAMGAALAWPAGAPRASTVNWQERRDLYAHGVASGDPTFESVILWTRRENAPRLSVEIAEDEAFARVVSTASVRPRAENDWTVRVLAAGLKPASVYWYRFSDATGLGSRIGRTVTAPAQSDPRPVQFAFVSCQNENLGSNNAYRRMIFEDTRKPQSEQLGFVLHLGDFFYELVWYPEDKKTYYARTVRDVLRYPHGEKHEDFHVPTDLEDYRTIYRAYLSDPDLADARARWPFVCIWDNHEFSWQGWQSYEDYGQGAFPAQTRKVAAAQAWFEYQPARVKKAGGHDLNRFDAPRVSNVTATAFDDHGLGLEANNLSAIRGLELFRSLRWGANVDLIITDNRSYRSQSITALPQMDAFDDKNIPAGFPVEVLAILDAGRSYNGGNPPETIRFAGRDIPNWRKNAPPQSILGETQKAWFAEKLRTSAAPWKLWGNSIGMLDARVDFQNLPAGSGVQWDTDGYATLTDDDWSGYRTERAQILDLVKSAGITGFASLAGDRHSFFAGVVSKALPPDNFDPVGLEFVTGSISAPNFFEAMEYKLPKDHPLHAVYVYRPKDGGAVQPALNLTCMHGVRASMALQETGDLKSARALSNPSLAPHLSFIDWGGHGYAVVRAWPDALETEFVCIPRPIARSGTEDGGPIAYRVKHRAVLWKAGDAPVLEQTIMEGAPKLSI